MATPDIPQSVKESVAASKAEYVRLGKSGLRVSIPILGAMSIGSKKTLPWAIEEEEVSCCNTLILEFWKLNIATLGSPTLKGSF